MNVDIHLNARAVGLKSKGVAEQDPPRIIRMADREAMCAPAKRKPVNNSQRSNRCPSANKKVTMEILILLIVIMIIVSATNRI